MIIITILLAYFALLMVLSRLTSQRATNETFYRANRRSPWYMVAFGMVGASISGVTFVSVPGMVMTQDMTYLQTCIGFIPGYFAVAFLLMPLYYRFNVTTIYTILRLRLGERAYKTGAAFFILSKLTGAAVRFYVVCIILQRFVLDDYGVPFIATVIVLAALIWLYTRRGGIKTLVWTDTLHTLCMFTALILIIYYVYRGLGMTLGETVEAIAGNEHSRVFVFDDFFSRRNFWKQFVSGAFIVIVMTGLDQDMMQKNLTCRSLRDAQKDLCSYGFAFVPANLLFLSLGVLLMMLADRQGVALPATGDELLPMFAATGTMGTAVLALFALGIVASSFSSADSALTALTTSWCVDICGRADDEQLRHKAHLGITAVFALVILLVDAFNSTSIIDAIYILCSYTYGPLLGLFAYVMVVNRLKRGQSSTVRVTPRRQQLPTDNFLAGDHNAACKREQSKRVWRLPSESRGNEVKGTPLQTLQLSTDKYVPYIAVASPVTCLAIAKTVEHLTGYRFGYEMLLLNGLITFIGLALTTGPTQTADPTQTANPTQTAGSAQTAGSTQTAGSAQTIGVV